VTGRRGVPGVVARVRPVPSGPKNSARRQTESEFLAGMAEYHRTEGVAVLAGYYDAIAAIEADAESARRASGEKLRDRRGPGRP